MMHTIAGIVGRMTLQDFWHGPIALGGQITLVGGVLGAVALVTYLKRWKWLWKEWLTSLDPKKIGTMYIVVAVVMLLRGLADAGLMRAQQAYAAGHPGFLTPDHFGQIFTAHGTMMIFFVAMGLMFGLINLILPQMIGSRDVAFPFLNSTSFYLYVSGAILINLSLLVGELGATGWLAYPPLSELAYSPGVGVDYWIWSIQIAGIGSLLSGVNFATTILRMRAKGMTLMKMPIFAWSVLGSMALVCFAFPILTVTLLLLTLDRTMGMHFFTSTFGGNPMMYVNMIWAWGHPEVYILILPAFGIFSEVVATFSKKRLFGYTSMVWAILSITVLSFVVWLHHFFTMGAGGNVNSFFGIMTMIISIPTGVKIFNWLFTMYRGRIHFTTPMYWFFGFVVTFTIGGVTGVMMAVPAIDFQLHNSLFLVAHFHNMVIGGVVFGYFCGISYWFPKFFGFKMHEKLGKLAFWFWIIGFATAFLPLYALGIMGATRRLDHYDKSLGWQQLFIVAAFGLVIILIGVLLQVVQLVYSIWKRNELRDTTGDPWDGRTLEWSTPTPQLEYNFAVLPEVTERDAFWEQKQSKKSVKQVYAPFLMPKHSGSGVVIGAAATAFGFAIIWHIWWLAIVAFVGFVVVILQRLMDDDVYETITVEQLKKDEKLVRQRREQYAK